MSSNGSPIAVSSCFEDPFCFSSLRLTAPDFNRLIHALLDSSSSIKHEEKSDYNSFLPTSPSIVRLFWRIKWINDYSSVVGDHGREYGSADRWISNCRGQCWFIRITLGTAIVSKETRGKSWVVQRVKEEHRQVMVSHFACSKVLPRWHAFSSWEATNERTLISIGRVSIAFLLLIPAWSIATRFWRSMDERHCPLWNRYQLQWVPSVGSNAWDPSFSFLLSPLAKSQQDFIIETMSKMERQIAINNVRCIQFRPKVSTDQNFITITNGYGCSSYVSYFTFFVLTLICLRRSAKMWAWSWSARSH